MSKMLTADQIASYRRDGYVAPVPVLNESEVAEYRRGLEDFERRDGAALDFPERSKSHLLFDWADAIVHHPNVLDAVEDLLGPDLLCYHLTMHIKEPRSEAIIIWHQDDDYFHLSPAEHVTAWVALSDATAESGCMRMAPGVCHEGLLPHTEDPQPNHLIRRGKGIFGRFADDAGELVPVPAGHMSLHHTHTPHASGPNRSNDRRIGVGISYIPAHVRPTTQPVSSALLGRGEDRYGHFHAETRLKDPESEAARTAHAQAYAQYMAATIDNA